MINLIDTRFTLQDQMRRSTNLPSHVGAFRDWVISDNASLSKAINEVLKSKDQLVGPEQVATLGFGSSGKLLSPDHSRLLKDEVEHLKGRQFFVSGRPLRFEVDGLALLGVSLAVAALHEDISWLMAILERAAVEGSSDIFQIGLINAARTCLTASNLQIAPADLAIALSAKGIGTFRASDRIDAWKLAVGFQDHTSGPARDAVRLAAFERILSTHGQIDAGAMTRESLVVLLQNVSRAMRLWRFESEKRTANSEVARWTIDNEYHVQSLIWSVLAPVFPDLENEENLKSVGHKNPRADLGIPSLRTIVEVKFMRNKGQAPCAKIIEEIAADASLYLSQQTNYDNIIAFVWDDRAQTEQHHELRSGLEAINGISAAIILSRPSSMERKTK
jgi:hypothetical protein